MKNFFKLLLVAWCVCAYADQGKIDPSTWRPDGVKEVWADLGDGKGFQKCNPYWHGRGVKPCGINYWFYFDTNPEWYPEVFLPPKVNYGNVEPSWEPKMVSIPEPSSLLMIGIGLVALWGRYA